jgi:hypothetical protein
MRLKEAASTQQDARSPVKTLLLWRLLPVGKPASSPTGILYTSCEWRHVLVNLSLTFACAFLLLKDLQRNRLAGRLMKFQRAPTLDNSRENTEQDAIAAACAAAVPARRKR